MADLDLALPNAPIAVLCAMESELMHLRASLPPTIVERYGERHAEVTTLGSRQIILACCGICMASAAAATEATIQRFAPVAVLNYGCSGAHRADLLPGDIVIGARVVSLDRISVEADGTERRLRMWYQHGGESKRAESAPASPELLDLAIRVAGTLEVAQDPWPATVGWPEAVPHRIPQVVAGTIGTSDRWTRSPARIAQFAALFQSDCEEMEAAAIALTCLTHDVPFLAVKDISNNELLRTTDHLFETETTGQLGRRAAALILGMLRELVGASTIDRG
jgi:adenosylhomocysteine nucleosidase